MRYRSKSYEIEAVQWKGDNAKEVGRIAPYKFASDGERAWVKAGKGGAMDGIPVPVGHWVARYPGDVRYLWLVDPDDFEAMYEPAGGVPVSVDVAAIREWLDFYAAGYSPPRLRQAREWLAALCDEVDALRAALQRIADLDDAYASATALPQAIARAALTDGEATG